jgi:hypothetical protein
MVTQEMIIYGEYEMMGILRFFVSWSLFLGYTIFHHKCNDSINYREILVSSSEIQPHKGINKTPE